LNVIEALPLVTRVIDLKQFLHELKEDKQRPNEIIILSGMIKLIISTPDLTKDSHERIRRNLRNVTLDLKEVLRLARAKKKEGKVSIG